jgi:hypothetical protein
MPGYRPPLSDDTAAYAAEQRWLVAAARLNRQLALTAIGIAAGLLATILAATNGLPALAGMCAVAVLGAMAWVIYLLVARHRTFIAIKMAGGMTKKEALTESNTRFG